MVSYSRPRTVQIVHHYEEEETISDFDMEEDELSPDGGEVEERGSSVNRKVRT